MLLSIVITIISFFIFAFITNKFGIKLLWLHLINKKFKIIKIITWQKLLSEYISIVM
jgi:hypothetical protein